MQYPYATDPAVRSQQIWSNLQTGLHLEETKRTLPWTCPYVDLDEFSLSKEMRSDRTIWHLGSQHILHGLIVDIEVMRWNYESDRDSIRSIQSHLGLDRAGFQKFNEVKSHLEQVLGEAHHSEIASHDTYHFEGSYTWAHQQIRIRLYGIDMHAMRYALEISKIK